MTKIPSQEIIELAREIQRQTTQAACASYQEPEVRFILKALLAWLDDYARAKQSELFLPTIQVGEDDGNKN